LWSVCFVPLDGNTPRIFGFPEFLTGFALIFIAWTLADVRYKFRLEVAPLPLQAITFPSVVLIGVLALITDLWRAEEWLVPRGNVITPSGWQAILAGAFLLIIISWVLFAFIRPAKYGMLNAKKYAKTLYRVIANGDERELRQIADEIRRSVYNIIKYAADRKESFPDKNGEEIKLQGKKVRRVNGYAADIILLIADKRFCRAIVEHSPITIFYFYDSISALKRYNIDVRIFSKNIVNAALSYEDSFLYHEDSWYYTGLIGGHRLISRAMFSDRMIVDRNALLFDVPYDININQLKVYCRIVLIAFDGSVRDRSDFHSFAIGGALRHMSAAISGISRLDNVSDQLVEKDEIGKLRCVIEFVNDALEIMDLKAKNYLQSIVREKEGTHRYIDDLVGVVYDAIHCSAYLKSNDFKTWNIQNNTIWMEIFYSKTDSVSLARKALCFRLRRKLYNEILQLSKFINYEGARILGYCLNVMGFSVNSDIKSRKECIPLHKAVLAWTRKNYSALYARNQSVAEACLIQSITYDPVTFRLIKTFPPILGREPRREYFDVDPLACPTVPGEADA